MSQRTPPWPLTVSPPGRRSRRASPSTSASGASSRRSYRIAEAASAADGPPGVLPEVHETVGADLRREPLHRAVRRPARSDQLPYYVDAVDLDIPDPRAWEPLGDGDARGITAYVLRTGGRSTSPPNGIGSSLAEGAFEHVGRPRRATGSACR